MVFVFGAFLLLLSGCMVERNTFATEVPVGMTRLAVDVENFRGAVIVDARSRFERVEVTQEVNMDGDGSDRKEAIAEAVELVASLEDVGDGNGVLRVRGVTELLDRDHTSRIVVSVPRCDGIRVENRGGFVELIDVGGVMFVSNAGGGVDVRTSRVVSDDVTILNVDGDVFLQIPEGSEGWVELESFDGMMGVKDGSGSFSDVHDNARKKTGRLGDGENVIQVRTNDGYLTLKVMENPLAYSRIVKRHARDAQDSWFLDGSRRYTRNLPEDAYLPEDRATAREAAEATAESESAGEGG